MCLDTVLSTSRVLTRWVLPTTVWHRSHQQQWLLCTWEETKTRSRGVTCLRSHSRWVAEMGFKPTHLAAGSMLLPPRHPVCLVIPCGHRGLHVRVCPPRLFAPSGESGEVSRTVVLPATQLSAGLLPITKSKNQDWNPRVLTPSLGLRPKPPSLHSSGEKKKSKVH